MHTYRKLKQETETDRKSGRQSEQWTKRQLTGTKNSNSDTLGRKKENDNKNNNKRKESFVHRTGLKERKTTTNRKENKQMTDRQ